MYVLHNYLQYMIFPLLLTTFLFFVVRKATTNETLNVVEIRMKSAAAGKTRFFDSLT